MSEPLKVALTALSGIIIFVIGQIVVKFIIEPIREQKKQGALPQYIGSLKLMQIPSIPAFCTYVLI